MYLRCPWLFGVAIGLSISFVIFLTIQAATDDFRPNIITNTLAIATAVAWRTWDGRSHDATKNRQRKDPTAEGIVREIRTPRSQ